MSLYIGYIDGGWPNFSYAGVASRISAYDVLVMSNPGVFVPDIGYNLRILSNRAGINLVIPTNLNVPIYVIFPQPTTAETSVTSITEFLVTAPKNSINVKQYVLGPVANNNSASATVLFEVS